MKNFKTLFSLLIAILLIFLPAICFAQTPDPGCNPDEPCPIDSEIYVLIIGAILFAAYNFIKAKKRKLSLQ